MTINIAIVGGNMAADPEYRDMPNGDPVKYMQAARVKKGTPLVICGERTTRSYEKDGRKQYAHELQIPNYGGKIWVINPRSGDMDTIGDNNGHDGSISQSAGTDQGLPDDKIPF